MGIETRKQLHVISTGKQSVEELVEISKSIYPYFDVLHLREKQWTGKEWTVAIDRLVKAGVPLTKLCVNDRADIAIMKHARGVQLGHQSADISLVKSAFPSLQIGASVHSLEEAQQAMDSGADYLLYGNIYATSSKPGKTGVGVASLEKMVQSIPLPIIGIGGITPKRVGEIMQTGAKGVAVLSGIFLSKDPIDSARSYYKELHMEVW
ncbi:MULTISPECIES: thiamine phosphate synthase [unclassified Rossellomorea]|uniref:thiamine phosphate synthase n=1 Tax=unclassified Rossellomorea TaxID=2837526 RepID=UPI0026292A7D|nr:thiamine phosphate synthase [uncultured Rossellomorea sp.]